VEKPRIFLIGVAHVFRLRDAVKDEILSIAPRAVCVELDNARLYALRHPEEISYKGLPIYLRLLGRMQRKLGKYYGVQAGEEMLAAIDTAKDIGAEVFLVDDDAYQSLRRMLKEMTFREKLRFISAFIPFPRKRGNLEDEMKKYESDEEAYIEEFARYFPTAKRILIDERNEHMAERIYRIGQRYERAVAVLGDAHLEGIRALLERKGADAQVIHMKDMQQRVRVTISYRHT
jgi:pheromone shutdown protein TraB